MPNTNETKRFWSRVDKNGPIPKHNPSIGRCWLWTGTKNSRGYGRFQVGNRRLMSHRWLYEQTKGQIATGLFACHKCDNPACVNPDHIFAGTQKENMTDARTKERIGFGSRHPLARLTEPQVLEIFNAENPKGIEHKYGIDRRTVYDIRTGKRWKHLTKASTLLQ